MEPAAPGTSHSGPVSIFNMMRRCLLLVALTAIAFGLVWFRISGKAAFLTSRRQSIIEVNGTPVPGEILLNKFSAIVTRRDAGKSHSYQLFFEGDVDFTGDMGSVVDCHEWVAPHLPFLLVTQSYPPCRRLPEDGPAGQRWPLIARGRSIQFVTKDHTTISVVTHE
jgi:hypothetical protein